jgi:PAS domain S-box-containing protein
MWWRTEKILAVGNNQSDLNDFDPWPDGTEPVLKAQPPSVDAIDELLSYQIELEMQNEELRLAQYELNESRNAFADLYELAPVGFISVSEEGIVLKANLTFSELVGKESRCVIKQRFSAFLIGEDHDAFYAFRRLVIASGEKQACDLRLHGDGAPIWIRLYGVAQRTKDATIQLRLVVADITEQKKTERLLGDSREKLLALLDSSPICNKVIDLESRLQFMSAAGVEQLKISDIEPFYGQPYPPEFYPESMRAPLTEHLDRAKAGKTSSVESPVLDMEGNELWYHTTFVPVRDNAGRVEYVIASSVDITERKQAEAKARRETEFLEMALAQSPSGILIADAPGGAIRFVNQAALEISGCKPSEMTDLDITEQVESWQVFRPDGSPYPPDQLPLSRAVLHGETVRDEELIVRDAGGNDHWINASAAPLHDVDGHVAAGVELQLVRVPRTVEPKVLQRMCVPRVPPTKLADIAVVGNIDNLQSCIVDSNICPISLDDDVIVRLLLASHRRVDVTTNLPRLGAILHVEHAQAASIVRDEQQSAPDRQAASIRMLYQAGVLSWGVDVWLKS